MNSTFPYRRWMLRLRNRRLWRAGSLLLAANAIALIFGLVRTPALTWLVPKDQVGMVGVVAAWLPYLQLLSLTGLDTSSYHFVAKGQPGAFAVNLVHRLRWSLLTTAGFLAGAAYWAWQGEPALAWMFVIAGLTYPMTTGLTAGGGMLAATENYTGLFWYRLAEGVVRFAGFIPLLLSVWWVSQAVTYFAANQVATAALQVGITYILLRGLQRQRARPLPPADQREVLRYGKQLTGMNAISVLQARIDSLLISLLFPLATVADYAIANLFNEQLRRLWNIFITMRYPTLVRLSPARRRRRIILEGALFWAVLIAAGSAIVLAAAWLVPLLLPPEYASSLGFVALLIGSTLVGVPGGTAELYFRMAQDARTQAVLRVIGAAVGVTAPLAVLAFLDWGANGVVAGRLIANLVLSLVGIWLVARDKGGGR